MPGYFIYCRKSTEAEDRQVLSIESQVREMRETAAKLNLSIAEVLTEAKSAKAPGRPVFNEMMQRLYRGEAAGIICWKLDRLARNAVDGGSIIWAIKQHGIKVFTPSQSYGQNDDNVILMYIEFGMAQKYIDDLSRNVKRGLKTKVENGWYPGIAPLGYLNDMTKRKGEKSLLKDPDRFLLLRRMWDLMLTGLYSGPRILDIASTEWGLRPRPNRNADARVLARSGIYRIFTNPFYYGWFEYPSGSGRWHRGQHEPMVTEAEFDRVQRILGRKGRPRASMCIFAFTGLIRCGACSSRVTAEEKHQLICSNCRFKFAYRRHEACPRCKTAILGMKKPKFLHYTYYHCTKKKNPECKEKSVSAEVLETQIDDSLRRIQISERFKDYAQKYLQELHKNESASRNRIVHSQHQAYEGCLRRLDNLVMLKTSPQNNDGSLLTDEEYGRQRLQLLKEKARLEEFRKDAGHRVEHWVKLTEQTFEFACLARERFAKGDANVKKEILVALGSNLTLMAKKLNIEARKPFLILESILSNRKPKKRPLEPKKRTFVEPLLSKTGLQISTKLREQDDVRTYGLAERLLVREIYSFFRSSSEADDVVPTVALPR